MHSKPIKRTDVICHMAAVQITYIFVKDTLINTLLMMPLFRLNNKKLGDHTSGVIGKRPIKLQLSAYLRFVIVYLDP